MYQKNYHIHFVGIGGIGMSGIAELLLGPGIPGVRVRCKRLRHHPAAAILGGHHIYRT